MAKASKQIVKSEEEKSVTTAPQLTEDQLRELEEDAVGSRDLVTPTVLPRLTILQAQSPQLNPRHEQYIEGARVGDIVDVVSRETFQAPLPVLPVIMDERFLEWAPREQGGGGLRGIYTKQEAGPRLARCRIDGPRRITSEGNTIDRTLQMHVLNLASFGSRCVVPFSRSGFRIGDQWLHNINKIKVTKPTGGWTGVRPWYKVWFLNVAERSNAKGTWLVFRPEEGPVFGKIGNEEPFMPDWQDYRKEAKEYEQAILRGEVQADYSSMDEGEAGEYGGGSATEDDNAPM